MVTNVSTFQRRRHGFGADASNQASPIYQALLAAYVRVRILNEASGGTLVGDTPGVPGSIYDNYTNAGNLLDHFRRADEGDAAFADYRIDSAYGPWAQQLATTLNAIQGTPVQDPGPPQPIDDSEPVVTIPVAPTGVAVTLPPDPTSGTVAVTLPSGEVVVGAGQQNSDGSITVATPNGGSVTGHIDGSVSTTTPSGQTTTTAAPASASSPLGIINSIESAITNVMSGIAAQFGVPVSYVEIGALILLAAGLYYSGIFSSKRR